jgi:hypothetical protein
MWPEPDTGFRGQSGTTARVAAGKRAPESRQTRRAGGLDRQIVVSEYGDVGITSGDVSAGGWTTADEWGYIVVSCATPVRTLFDSTLSPMRSMFRQPCFRWFAVREAVFQVPHHHAQLQRGLSAPASSA